MTIAFVAHQGTITGIGWAVLIVGTLVGTGFGLVGARTVKMTDMPQLVSLFNAAGGGAAALVALTEFFRIAGNHSLDFSDRASVATVLDVIIGAVTLSGSLIAAGKLQGVVNSAPVTFPTVRLLNAHDLQPRRPWPLPMPIATRSAGAPVPRVSVIVATRNRPALLERALRSLTKQTFQDSEVVVVADGDGVSGLRADRHRGFTPASRDASSPAASSSRSRNFWILPEPVSGNASHRNHRRGTLCAARCSLQNASSASGAGVPGVLPRDGDATRRPDVPPSR